MKVSFAARMLVILVLTGVFFIPVHAQIYRSFRSDSKNILEGNWQSCRETNGEYAERVYDHVVNEVGLFEIHMGPKWDFAIFKDVIDEHRLHDGIENLLGHNTHEVPIVNGYAKKRWAIPSLNLVFTVTMAGGSRTDCESWYVLLEPLDTSR